MFKPLMSCADAQTGRSSGEGEATKGKSLILFLMAVLSEALFTFVCGDFMTLSFLTTRHNAIIFFSLLLKRIDPVVQLPHEGRVHMDFPFPGESVKRRLERLVAGERLRFISRRPVEVGQAHERVQVVRLMP